MSEISQRPDYRWEKIVKAVMAERRCDVAGAVNVLLQQHQEWDAATRAEVMQCGKLMRSGGK